MNIRRGLFRFWLIFAAIFILGIAVVSYRSIKQEFNEADWKEFAKTAVLMVPYDCNQARGAETKDYVKNLDPAAGTSCWYKSTRFRELYPEYAKLSNEELSKQQYPKFGLPLKETNPSPWHSIFVAGLIATGVPVAVLLLGWLFGWAFAGFADIKSN